MRKLDRITFDPNILGGMPFIRGLRVSVGTVARLAAAGHSMDEILKVYPYLEEGDIGEALAYAAWRAEAVDIPLFGV